jgi:cytochrome c oxidase assembly protein subunit 15
MKTYRSLLLVTVVMTFALIVLGAYVRLSDAGLGCPDWPGCYGHVTVTQASDHISAAQEANPMGPVTFAKAWKEMIHRYFAGIVGLFIVAIAALAWRNRSDPGASPWLATLLVGVLGLQAMFGKWTVTMLLKPAIVTGHLIGGLTVLALLVCLYARTLGPVRREASPALRIFALFAFVILAAQISLGGWVSTNYAALACSDLPTCRGAWVPEMDLANGFHVIRELGVGADGEIAATIGIALIAGAAAAVNCLIEQKIDAVMARTRAPPAAARRSEFHRQTLAVLRRDRRHRAVPPLLVRQSAHDVADAGDLHRLRDHLHGAAQAGDAAEHRDRRCLRRHAARPGLGRRDRRGELPRRCCCSSSSSRGRRRISGRWRSIAPRNTPRRACPCCR